MLAAMLDSDAKKERELMITLSYTGNACGAIFKALTNSYIPSLDEVLGKTKSNFIHSPEDAEEYIENIVNTFGKRGTNESI